MLKRKPSSLQEVIGVLREHKDVLVNKFGVTDIAIFGSYVRNEQKKRSDIDILIELKQEYETFNNYMELVFFLEKKMRGKVDVVMKEGIRKELRSIILQEAVPV
ncbi:MAG: nucleotidyltransferase family protein [Nitrospirae bacterium]|uniref:nucleotidyltransferase family protein n=1 Tax=Candidatus Magnetobacterium casense TaxID=1455061 RepID=UPI00058E824F|nr:nucleotidyltransferase family protein [Candidatus Magnetobacterium casensis]MBF0337738.1 nucleotidyltransferase family protein [Nitrospirota bacterium]